MGGAFSVGSFFSILGVLIIEKIELTSTHISYQKQLRILDFSFYRKDLAIHRIREVHSKKITNHLNIIFYVDKKEQLLIQNINPSLGKILLNKYQQTKAYYKQPMPSEKTYLFQSERLGFRNWTSADIEPLATLNADPTVMKFFPSTNTYEQTSAFVERMQAQFLAKGFCYFAVDELQSGNFIGFIGISAQNYPAHFTPCVDIGWRLQQSAWNKGYATEGAKRCLQYAFEVLTLEKIYAVAPKINLPSENVMRKIGMQKSGEFEHPALLDDERLKICVLYELAKEDFLK